MSWSTTMTTLLRVIINDMDSESYTDARLQKLLINAAQLVYSEIDTTITYAIDIVNETLSPDPTAADTKDDAFFNLIVLKAACLVDQGQYRTQILLSGLTAKLGPAMLETGRRSDAFKDLINIGACKMYEIARNDFMFGNGNVCRAILSPFVGNDFDPNSIDSYGCCDRARL